MKKRTYFDEYDGPGWPAQSWLAPYFLTDAGRRQAFDLPYGNDHWGLMAEGLEGTEHLPQWKGRIDIRLDMIGNIEHGVLLFHRIIGRSGTGHYSIADRGKLREWLETKHGDLRPIGLFIPFEAAWKAVKEFMEKDGELPRSIPWVAASDLPPGTFPSP
jgi:Immunity protein Imm1